MDVCDTATKHTNEMFVAESDAVYLSIPGLKEIIYQHEFLALRTYTGASYENMNGVLRGKIPDPKQEWLPVNNSAIRALDKLAKSPEYQHKGTVFRGTGMSTEKLHQRFVGIGEIYQDKGFSSCSTDKGVAHGPFFLENVKITANARSGVKVDTLSATDGESEVLFKPDTKFVITKKELSEDGKTWDIHLDEV